MEPVCVEGRGQPNSFEREAANRRAPQAERSVDSHELKLAGEIFDVF